MDDTGLGTMTREELLAELLRERSERTLIASQKAAAESRKAELEFELAQLKRMIFGSKSERFVTPANPNQLELDLGLAVQIAREEAKKEAKPKSGKKPGAKKPVRQPIPDKFPRNVVVIEPSEDTTGMEHIGDEESLRVSRRKTAESTRQARWWSTNIAAKSTPPSPPTAARASSAQPCTPGRSKKGSLAPGCWPR